MRAPKRSTVRDPKVPDAVARLLKKVRSEILKEVRETCRKEGRKEAFEHAIEHHNAIYLWPINREYARLQVGTVSYSYKIFTDLGNRGTRVTMFRDHVNAFGLDTWHPAHWIGTEVRIDARGREWARQIGPCVMDDFGNLVEVPA